MGIFLLMFLVSIFSLKKRIFTVILCGKGFYKVTKSVGFIGNVFYH